MKSSLHITNDGNTIRAKGAAAQTLFGAMTKKSIVDVVHHNRENAVRAAGYSLHQFAPDRYWLENPDGEGMETSVGKVHEMLRAFFQREF